MFASASYSQAVSQYDQALASLPNYLEYEIAVLRSNIAACHLKLRDWQAAIDSATASIDALDRASPVPSTQSGKKKDAKTGEYPSENDEDDDAVVEIEAEDEAAEQAALQALNDSVAQKHSVLKIRTKSLLRRAHAKQELGGWANLAAAEEDYKLILSLSSSPSSSLSTSTTTPVLPPADLKVVKAALSSLPAQITAAREKETAEMMGKLKELGNGILKPFGLSTDNFKMVQDEKTGGYSVNFGQGR